MVGPLSQPRGHAITHHRELLQSAAAFARARNFQAAVETYRRLLEEAPEHVLALKGLADACRGLKDICGCLEAWDRYLALKPGDLAVQTRVGDAARRAGKPERAAAHYQAALRHDPANRYALMGLGELHLKDRHPDQALACWERLLELDPTLLHIRTMAGNLCRRRLDFGQAELHFREVLRLEPHNPHAVFGLADALRGQGCYEEAAPFWDEILLRDPKNVQVLCRAGDCFGRLGRLVEAEQLFRRALVPGYDRSALLGLARVLALMGLQLEAAHCLETILTRNPLDARAGGMLAQGLDPSTLVQ